MIGPWVKAVMEQRVELWHQPQRGEKILLFSHVELACPATGIVKLADHFAAHLVDLRVAWGRPMKVNSCCRSEAHNKAIGGHPKSLHVYDHNAQGLNGTAALDVATPSGAYACGLVKLALSRGWSVGVAKTFIHLDRRDLAGLEQAVFGY